MKADEAVETWVGTCPDQPGARAVVHWREADGRAGYGSPLPMSAAIAMLNEYSRRHPERRYWLQEIMGPKTSP